MVMKKIQLTDNQRQQINKMWFVYGNHGEKANHNQHRLIQIVLEEGLFDAKKETLYFGERAAIAAKLIDPKHNFNDYKISKECFNTLKKIIDEKQN